MISMSGKFTGIFSVTVLSPAFTSGVLLTVLNNNIIMLYTPPSLTFLYPHEDLWLSTQNIRDSHQKLIHTGSLIILRYVVWFVFVILVYIINIMNEVTLTSIYIICYSMTEWVLLRFLTHKWIKEIVMLCPVKGSWLTECGTWATITAALLAAPCYHYCKSEDADLHKVKYVTPVTPTLLKNEGSS